MTMTKIKAAFIKCLPLLIVLASIGLFGWGIRAVTGLFFAPQDAVYTKEYDGERFTVISCKQGSSSHYYIYRGEFSFNEEDYSSVASEHDRAHLSTEPDACFTLNETPLDIGGLTVKTVTMGNGLDAMQFGEFIVYRLEGQYGVIAPLRDYDKSSTSRKNDLYVVRQLMKEERWQNFALPDWETPDGFLKRLEKIEWYLDTEYIEDN